MSPRTAQYLAASLAALLIILVGGVIFVVLNRPAQGPTPSPTPTSVAALSPGVSPTFSPIPTLSPAPSPTLLPTTSPELTPSPIPIDTPLTTPEVTPFVTPEISPTLEPTLAPPTATPLITPVPTPTAPPDPTSPDRELRVTGFGLDSKSVTGIERYVLFGVDGPSLVRVELGDSTGRTRVCLWQGDLVEQRVCRTIRNGVLEQAVYDAGSTDWTISLISADTSTSPVVDLTIDFNANAPSVAFENVRFQGIPVANYNGITAAFDALPGSIAVSGHFDPGQLHSWHVAIDEAGAGSALNESGGPANSFGPFTVDVTAANTGYLVTVFNPNNAAEPTPVFVRLVISGPFVPPA